MRPNSPHYARSELHKGGVVTFISPIVQIGPKPQVPTHDPKLLTPPPLMPDRCFIRGELVVEGELLTGYPLIRDTDVLVESDVHDIELSPKLRATTREAALIYQI